MNQLQPPQQDSRKTFQQAGQNTLSKNFVGKKIDDFIMVEVLGTGAFGQVFLAQNISTGKQAAIKSVSKNKLREHNGLVGQLLKTEVSLLADCDNPNVVKMIKYLESDNNCYIVMEFCNQGDLEQRWKKKGKIIPENEAKQYMKQILNGMRGLHEKNVIHRDLKLPNILIANDVLKIGDLGFAKRLENLDGVVKEALGTLGTMAPEVIEFKPYGIQADMFSLGAIYYQLLFGQLPFSLKSYDDFLKDVKQNPPNFQRGNVRISQESQNLLTRMLHPDPKQRLQWKELFNYSIFSDKQEEPNLAMKQPLTVERLMGKQVDMQLNEKVYNQKQEQFEKITNQNLYNNLGNTELNKKDVIDPTEDMIQFEQAKKQQEQEALKQQQLNQIFELYLNERNTLVFLATVLYQIHNYHHSTNTNVFLPAFIIVKKLMIEMNKFVDVLKKQQNIFNCQFFVELNLLPQFKMFVKQCEEDYQMFNGHFTVIKSQLQTILLSMARPNPNYLEELQPHPTQIFEENYRDILLNYYMQLQDEKENAQGPNGDILTNMMIQVLDTILYDKTTRNILLQKKVDDYFDEYNFFTTQEKEKIVEKKFTEIFTFM